MAEKLTPEERRLAAIRKLIAAQAQSDEAQKKALGTARLALELEKQIADLKGSEGDLEKDLLASAEKRLKTLGENGALITEAVSSARELLEEEDEEVKKQMISANQMPSIR